MLSTVPTVSYRRPRLICSERWPAERRVCLLSSNNSLVSYIPRLHVHILRQQVARLLCMMSQKATLFGI